MPEIEEDRLYTTTETAEIFDVTARTIQNWLRKTPPIFPHAKQATSAQNSPWLIPGSDIIAELERQEQGKEPE